MVLASMYMTSSIPISMSDNCFGILETFLFIYILRSVLSSLTLSKVGQVPFKVFMVFSLLHYDFNQFYLFM